MQAALNPRSELRSGPVTWGTDIDETSHWPTSEIHGPRLWLRERFMVGGGPGTDDEVLSHDATAHMTIHHECQTAKHSPFRERKVAR
jgi:hypothetical protein